jgi:PPOX class probable F420-dependent enzyme
MESMTKAEYEAFLDAPARSATIATVREDGRPHAATIWFVRDGERIVFTSWYTSVKVKNILRDGRVSLLVDHDVAPWHYVILEGRAAVIDKSVEGTQYWTKHIAARYVGEDRAEAVTMGYAIEGEWVFEMIPEKVIAHKNVVSI